MSILDRWELVCDGPRWPLWKAGMAYWIDWNCRLDIEPLAAWKWAIGWTKEVWL